VATTEGPRKTVVPTPHGRGASDTTQSGQFLLDLPPLGSMALSRGAGSNLLSG